MILSDTEILQRLDDGNIVISPFQEKHLNPNSVDLTLNPTCKVYRMEYKTQPEEQRGILRTPVFEPAVLDCRKDNPTVEFEIGEEGYVLSPNIVYLYRVNEEIGVGKNVCARVEGKSSLGRLGLFVHITAGWIDAGFRGSLVLELHCVQPIRIYPNMKIAQICFMQVAGKVREAYGDKAGSKYMNQTGVQASKMHENFTEDERTFKRKMFEKATWVRNPLDLMPENPMAEKGCTVCGGHGVVDTNAFTGTLLENCPNCWR